MARALTLALLALLIPAAAPAGASPAPTSGGAGPDTLAAHASHQNVGAAPAPALPTAAETREEFLAVCRALRAGDDPFHGEAAVAELEALLARPGQSPEVAAGVRGRLGGALLRLGRPAAAAARFDEGLAIAERAGLSAELRLQLTRDLALALLQQAEDENCVDHHHAASCILPVAPEGIHRRAAATRRAGDLYLAYLAERPEALQPRWLLNLARMVSGDYPQGVPEPLRLPADALRSEAALPRWPDRAGELGVNALDLSGGAAMDDFDGDGLLDLVSSTWDPCAPMKAFRNDGAGGFEDVAAAWGLDGQLGGLNLVHADYDGDGDLDLLVLRGAWQGARGEIRNSLLRNDLDAAAGRFVDVTRAAGLAAVFPTQTAAWADYDGDGDLDLYVGAEATPERPHPGRLYRNDGTGAFTDVAATAGVANARFAKAAAWGDFDDDGDPDLYVSNFGPNRLYRNQGDGTFVDVAPELGVTGPETSFPSWFFDVDNDGDLDLFVADYGTPYEQVSASYLGYPVTTGHPYLYRNDGGRFTEVSRALGLTRPLLPMGSNHGDLDNDGFPDLYLGTGVPDLESLMPNVAYLNVGGERFADVTFAIGFGHLQKGHGIAFGDLDGDGDQDLFEQMGGAYPVDAFYNALYENPGNENAWITLRLEGRRANRFALGGRIEVRVRNGETARSVHALVGTGGSFGSSSLQAEIGLGAAESIEAVIVRWPGSGTVQTFRDVAPRRAYLAVEGEPALVPLALPRLRLGGGERPPHRHHPPG